MTKRVSLAVVVAGAVLAAFAFAGAGEAETAPEAEAPILSASFSPQSLGREKASAISLHLGLTVPPKEGKVPGLKAIRFGISRRISLRYAGLPACSLHTLLSSYAEDACPRSLVGRGFVVSEVTLPEQEPVMIYGVAKAYYSFAGEQPRILLRVVSGEPLPLVYVIPFEIHSAAAPYKSSIGVIAMWKAITGICRRGSPGCPGRGYTLQGVYSHISELQLSLHRRFRNDGLLDSFVSAQCAIPAGQTETTFPLATMTLLYPDQAPTASLSGRCKPRD